jgi:hypothetical protein
MHPWPSAKPLLARLGLQVPPIPPTNTVMESAQPTCMRQSMLLNDAHRWHHGGRPALAAWPHLPT